jgi:hypothetical protein
LGHLHKQSVVHGDLKGVRFLTHCYFCNHLT